MPDDVHPEGSLTVRNSLPLAGTAGGMLTVAPRSMGEVIEVAKLMSVSSFAVRPAFRNNPGACLAIAMQAFRSGGDPFAWANKAYITKNKAGEEQISYEAQLVHAVVNSSHVLQRRLRTAYEGEGSTRKCIVTGWIKGETEPLEYESPPIGKIAVKNSPLWAADPDQQLAYYSTRAWARRHVPEILMGIYAPDEFAGETIDVTPEPEPRRQDFVQPAEQQQVSEDEEEKNYSVIDLDGEMHTFHDPAVAERALNSVLIDAARQGKARLEGSWEDNMSAVVFAPTVSDRYLELLAEIDANERAAQAKAEAEAATQKGGDAVNRGRGAPEGSGFDTTPPSVEAGAEQPQDRQSLALPPPPTRNGKPDWRSWVLAMYLPKLRRITDGNTLAWFIGDNAEARGTAEATLIPSDKRDLENAVAAQWEVVKQAEQEASA